MFGITRKLFDALLNVVVTSKDQVIAAQIDYIAILKEEVVRERTRADLAVDKLLCLQLKQNVTVMPERSGIMTAEEKRAAVERSKELSALKTELEKVGDCGGDPEPHAPTHTEEIVV